MEAAGPTVFADPLQVPNPTHLLPAGGG